MKDSGHPAVSGTNTLTIVIGDVNDNVHSVGHKDIYVYSYRGEHFVIIFILAVCFLFLAYAYHPEPDQQHVGHGDHREIL